MEPGSQEDEAEPRLTAAEVAALRERLERMRAELRGRIGRERPVELEAERESEPMDAAEQTREQDDAVLFSQRDRALLGEVEHALSKMEAGRYGVSELSGRQIELRRLMAIPWTRLAADEAERT